MEKRSIAILLLVIGVVGVYSSPDGNKEHEIDESLASDSGDNYDDIWATSDIGVDIADMDPVLKYKKLVSALDNDLETDMTNRMNGHECVNRVTEFMNLGLNLEDAMEELQQRFPVLYRWFSMVSLPQ